MISIVYPDRLSSERTNALGPEPGMIGRIGQMTCQLFLNVLVFRLIYEAENQVRAPDNLGEYLLVDYVAKQKKKI